MNSKFWSVAVIASVCVIAQLLITAMFAYVVFWKGESAWWFLVMLIGDGGSTMFVYKLSNAILFEKIIPKFGDR